MTSIRISPPVDVENLAQFIVELNEKSETHIGYCGVDKREIVEMLQSEFSDLELSKSFAVAYDEDVIIGALGLDIDEASKSAEVWGPFVQNVTQFSSVTEDLWKAVNTFSKIELKEFSFFVNKENAFVRQFATNRGAIEKGSHFILKAYRKDLVIVDTDQIEKYRDKHKNTFIELHQSAFPNTYYSAGEILNRINEYNQLFVMLDNANVIKGYVYVEASPEHKEGMIEYIAVSNAYQKLGIGTKLIRAALAFLFSFDRLEEITLCVGKENEGALNLYKAAGFVEVHELVHYVYKNKEEQ